MRVKIEIEEGLAEEEVIIRCGSLNDTIVSLQNYISRQGSGRQTIIFLWRRSISLRQKAGRSGRIRQGISSSVLISFMNWRNCCQVLS